MVMIIFSGHWYLIRGIPMEIRDDSFHYHIYSLELTVFPQPLFKAPQTEGIWLNKEYAVQSTT